MFPGDDYISIRVGQAMMDNADIGPFLLGRPLVHLSNMDTSQSKFFAEGQLPSYPENLTISDSWQNVNGSRYKFFVFSAYYDQRRNQRSI
ncbi:hypothetical protein D910_12423, partial [Dendroctonus ponderosae]